MSDFGQIRALLRVAVRPVSDIYLIKCRAFKARINQLARICCDSLC